MASKTTIEIWKTTRDRLLEIGKMHDSYDDVLTRLIDLYERSQMTSSQIDAASPSEVFEATHVIERALEVLRGEIPEVDQ